MRLVFIGTGAFGEPALKALLAAGHEVTTVISQPDRPAGRGRELQPTPIRTAAAALGLPHVQAEDINGLELRAAFGGAEIGVVAAFGQKIGGALLAALPRGCVNIHGALLPKYRGAAPYQWAILNGDEVTGVTVFQLNERWDAGEILGQRETPIGETETADELHDRLALLGAELIVATIADLATGRATPRTQDVTQATRAPKLSKADSVVDWSQAASKVVRRIHGLWSWPAATCLLALRSGKQERVLLARATVAHATATPTEALAPGAFCADRAVQTGAGRVRLLEVRPASGKLMTFEAFANGRHIDVGDRFLPAGAG
jgi:methionyl-tRNA formyltransferase